VKALLVLLGILLLLLEAVLILLPNNFSRADVEANSNPQHFDIDIAVAIIAIRSENDNDDVVRILYGDVDFFFFEQFNLLHIMLITW